ncbi:MAG TPA: hypothetical protein VIK27_12980 [Candidatus Aquilonibacter sp.]
MQMFKVISVAAAVAVLVSGTAAAQQSPSDGSNASGPIAIFKNMQAEPDGVSLAINGQEIDRLESVTYDDVTSVVHAGTNTLVVTWNGPVQKLNFKVAYAPTRNDFENVAVVQADSSSDAALRQAGSRTVTFTIPDGVGR